MIDKQFFQSIPMPTWKIFGKLIHSYNTNLSFCFYSCIDGEMLMLPVVWSSFFSWHMPCLYWQTSFGKRLLEKVNWHHVPGQIFWLHHLGLCLPSPQMVMELVLFYQRNVMMMMLVAPQEIHLSWLFWFQCQIPHWYASWEDSTCN